MTCLYETIMDDMIRAFMHILKYRYWLKRESSWKRPDETSLKLKTAMHSNPKLLAEAMRSDLRAKDFNTRKALSCLDQPRGN